MTITRLAIYDMDRTITVTATYPPFLRFAVTKLAPWRAIFVVALPFLFAAYALKLLDRGGLKEWLQGLFVGTSVDRARLDGAARLFAERMVADNVFDKARARITADREEGYEILLCSASFSFYVNHIGEKIGIAPRDILATELHAADPAGLSARIDGANCYGPEKCRRVEAWLAARGLTREACYIRAYSDHESDEPLLDYADEAFAATPTPRMRRVAQVKGWPVLDFCEESEHSL